MGFRHCLDLVVKLLFVSSVKFESPLNTKVKYKNFTFCNFSVNYHVECSMQTYGLGKLVVRRLSWSGPIRYTASDPQWWRFAGH